MPLMRIVVAALEGPEVTVGVVRHRYASERAFTVVLKAVLRFTDAAEATVDRAPGIHGRISLDRPAPATPGVDPELVYASDFAPQKAFADVLLVGHARGPRTNRMTAAVGLGRLERPFLAVAGQPSSTIPLWPPYLRELDGITPAQVGPLRVEADPTGSFGPGFDFSVFNAAPPLQRTDIVEPDATIELRQLSAGGAERQIRLPALAPRVYVDCGDDEGALVNPPCDTIWIDTDEDRIVLVWRGVVLVNPSQVERMIVALEPAQGGRNLRAMLRAAPRARFAFAAEADRLDPAAQDEDEQDELLIARHTALCAEHGVDPTLSMDGYAAVAAELAEAGAARSEVLGRHHFTEDSWFLEERGWMERITTAAEAGNAEPATDYGDRFRAAQERLAAPTPETTLEDYAAIVAAMEVEDTGKVLPRHKLTVPAWTRLERRWSDAIDADPALAQRYEQALGAARAATPEPTDGEEGVP